MSDVKALFGLIDKKNKRRLIGAVICCVLSVLCGILPYLGVWGIVTCFLDERTENLFQYVCLIAAAIILKHLLFGTGTKISHKVAYQTLGETRKKLFRKIARLPMGYVKTTASGQVKTIIMDNMEQLETFYAHNIPEIISGLAVPLCMEILLVILDIRVAGIMLIPVVLFILVGILKLKAYDKAEKLVSKSDKANVNALFEKFKKDNPNASSNPLSRWRQKHNIKKEYAAARAGKGGKATAKGAGKTAKGVKSLTQKIADFCVSHKTALLWVLAIGLLFMVISGMFSACSTMFQGGTQVVLGTSFTAEDEDILGTDEDYTALENDLRSQVDNIESTHPGYDEYRYALDEIGHNPYELAAYLTVVFEDYTREEVQAELVRLFEEQYDLELDEEVEIRSYTTTDEDGNTSTVYYEYRILNVTLTNYGLGNVIASSRLTAEQWERYKVLLETLGNRSYLFGEDVSSAPGGGGEYTDYDIPGEALTDTAFANMVREAEKYLGYPYVWGGSSPSTSFDCSGFVSWVINNCGNGWSVGRQTANGLKNLCDIIPPSEAKPGDLIFFQGTYNTSGASHVGIYVGNGMMIHCGDPISYASIETNYWQQHFYCFGRIP